MRAQRDATRRRVEDAEWMLDHGEWPERAARRLGMSLPALERMMRRHSTRQDLTHQVARVEQQIRTGLVVAA